MKTVEEVIKKHKDFEEMILEIDEKLNNDFTGFTSHKDKDSITFWKKYKKNIISILEQDAKEYNTNIIDLVKCCNLFIFCNFTKQEIKKALYEKYNKNYDYIYYNLASYAVETICSWYI